MDWFLLAGFVFVGTLTLLVHYLEAKNAPEKSVSLDDLEIGQLVEVKFHDPRELGLQVPGQLTCTRFNPDEFENRTFQAFVSYIGKWDGGPKYGQYAVFSLPDIQNQRQFLLLKQEIDTIRLLK